jgi:hypothetical protein
LRIQLVKSGERPVNSLPPSRVTPALLNGGKELRDGVDDD